MKSELLTIDKKRELLKAIAEKAFSEIVAQTKSANPKDVGTFKMIISDNTMDRQGDMVDQNGFDIDNYMKHPVVLWGHDYFSLPIGITDKVYREDNKTIAEGRFAPTDEAQKIRKYYDAGYPVAASVGYIPKDSVDGQVIAAELLEWSFVTVPANANCISADEARMHGLDIAFLTTKGFKFEDAKKKEAEEGAACQLDDGTPGVLAKDPKNPDGAMICIPEKSTEKKEDENRGDPTNPDKDEMDARLKERLKEIHEHSKAIDEHVKAQQGVIAQMLDLGNDDEGGEKSKKPSELKSESSGIKKEMTLDDAIKAGNIVKECLRTAVTKAAEALEGIRKAEKRLPVKR